MLDGGVGCEGAGEILLTIPLPRHSLSSASLNNASNFSEDFVLPRAVRPYITEALSLVGRPLELIAPKVNCGVVSRSWWSSDGSWASHTDGRLRLPKKPNSRMSVRRVKDACDRRGLTAKSHPSRNG